MCTACCSHWKSVWPPTLPVADTISVNETLHHCDQPRIAQLSEKVGLCIRALRHYTELKASYALPVLGTLAPARRGEHAASIPCLLQVFTRCYLACHTNSTLYAAGHQACECQHTHMDPRQLIEFFVSVSAEWAL